MKITKEISYWPLKNNETKNIVLLDTYGNTLDELIDNAELVLEDWHGNEAGFISIGELHRVDYEAIEELIKSMFVKKGEN